MTWLSDKTIHHLRKVTNLPDLSNTKYKCLQKIASGGMGTIYLAEDTQLHREIALKILDIPDPDGDLADRMQQEAYIIAALEHPSIVPIHDVGTLPDGRIFYTMKFVKGRTLADEVKKSTALPEFLRIFQKLCEGVAFAHSHDVIHRDLKPENIMVGDFGEVLVMDWGLAKLLSPGNKSQTYLNKNKTPDSNKSKKQKSGELSSTLKTGRLTEHGTVMGTPAYMAPEQERGEIDQIDQRTDGYSLGAILKFLMTSLISEEKSKTSSISLFKNRQRKIPKQLNAISEKAMSGKKEDRYKSALELVAEIENFLNGSPVTAYKENFLEISWRWLNRYKFLIFLILVYVFVRLLIFFLRYL